METVYDKRWWVKIVAGPKQSDSKTIYYRVDLPFSVLTKWMWYFQYLAALYRTRNPRHYVCLDHGGDIYIPTAEQKTKQLKDKIINKKGKITLFENKLAAFRKSWDELFPVEDYEPYQKATLKVAKLKLELEDLIKQHTNIK